MPITLNTSNVVFNNSTVEVTAPPFPSESVYGNFGFFFQNNLLAETWNGAVLWEASVDNKTTEYAYSTGKQLIISGVYIAEKIYAGGASSNATVSTHTACWVLEGRANTSASWFPIAATYTQYNSGTYYGGSMGIPRNLHICNVRNPSTGSSETVYSSLPRSNINRPVTPTQSSSADGKHGFALSSTSFLLRQRFYSLAANASPWQTTYKSSNKTFTTVLPDTTYEPLWNTTPSTLATGTRGRGFSTFRNTNSNLDEQATFARVQSLPYAGGTNYGYDISIPTPISVGTAGQIEWSCVTHVKFNVNDVTVTL